jgi:hypothetical protein
MTLEQPANLNYLAAKPLPVNWTSRWKFIRPFLPTLVFFTIVLLENISFKLWQRDMFEISRLWIMLLLPGFLLVVLLVSNEIKLRKLQGNRLLNVFDKGVSFRADGRPFLRWSNVIAFWFEDIPGELEFSKVTVEYFRNRKTKFPCRESLALNKRDQCPALLSELRLLQQQYGLAFRVELDKRLPIRKPLRNPVWGMSLGLAGILFLLNGVPLILVPLAHEKNALHHSESDKNWSPKQKEKFTRFLNVHFSSKAELNRFMIEAGSTLSIIGIGLLIWGTVVQRQKTEEKSPKIWAFGNN